MLVDRAIQAWHGRVASRFGKVPEPDRLAAFDTARWQRELTEDLAPLVGDTEASLMAARVTDEHRRLLELERMAHV